MKGIYYDLNIPRAVLKKAGLGTKYSMIRYRDDWPMPEIRYPRQVRVKSRQGGICAGDLHQINVSLPYSASIIASKENPFPMGHEVVGEVVELGREAKNLNVGQRVVFSPIAHCAAYGFAPCKSCAAGHFNTCQAITGIGDGSPLEEIYGGRARFGGFLGGGFSEYFVAFEKQLTPVPDSVPDRIAVLAEPFTIGIHAVLRRLPTDNETALVIGGGIIGLLAIAAIRAHGSKCKIIAIAKYPFQASAAKNLGANEAIADRNFASLSEKIAASTGGTLLKPVLGNKVIFGANGPDVVFDTVGTDSSIDDALRLVRCNGTIVLIGMAFGITKKTEWALQIYKELNLLGAINSGLEQYGNDRIDAFELAVKFLEREPAKYEDLVTHTFRIDDYRAAFSMFSKKSSSQAIKIAFDFT